MCEGGSKNHVTLNLRRTAAVSLRNVELETLFSVESAPGSNSNSYPDTKTGSQITRAKVSLQGTIVNDLADQ